METRLFRAHLHDCLIFGADQFSALLKFLHSLFTAHCSSRSDRTKRSYFCRSSFTRRQCLVIFVLFQWLAASSSPVLAKTTQIPGLPSSFNVVPVAPTQLPVLNNVISGISSMSTNTSTDTLTIHQNQSTALINWQSFNIGQNATVHFDQQGNRTWGVL